MGYNTTVVVLNDALQAIAEDSEFGNKLKDAISVVNSVPAYRPSSVLDVSAMGHANAATVIETHHADYLQAVAVGGNMGVNLGYAGYYDLWNQPVEMLKCLAEQHGYTLRKKSTKRTRREPIK
jgi:hypothetical protein